MIDFNPSTSCRICLADRATIPIFECTETSENVHSKLAQCFKEKIEDIEGYPRNICASCKSTSDAIYSFLNKFRETCKILQNKIVIVKTEFIDYSEICDDDKKKMVQNNFQVENGSNIEPKLEKKDATELLGSLPHLTIKRVKIENNSESQNSSGDECAEFLTSIQSQSAKQSKVVPKNRERKAVVSNTANKSGIKYKAESKKIVTRAQKPPNSGSSKALNSGNVNAEAISLVDLKQLRREKEAKTSAAIKAPKLCDLCGEIFKTALNLAKHKKRMHLERKFKCSKCPKSYITQRDLNIHVLRKHENVRTATCDLCGKTFFTKSHLRKHIATMHVKDSIKRKITFKCEFCDKSFHYKRGIIVHVRAVHTGERPSECNICGSAFYDDVYLAEHMRIHTGDTPFKCPVCNRGYTQRGNMKSHMRNHKISELDAVTLSKLKPNYFKFMRP